jgi:haloalkane dehalogenase
MDSAAQFYAKAAVRKTEVGPTRYAWRQYGSGPPLLLIHGFPLSGFTWRKLLPELAQGHTCYVPDLAGLGETEWTDATDFTWHGQARGLKGLVDQIGLKDYAVMGHDTGGSFARCLALTDPRVNKLAIINSEIPGHRPPWIPLYQALMHVPGTLAAFSLLLRSRAFLRSPLGFGGCFTDLSLLEGEFHTHFVEPLLREPRRLDGMRLYLRELKWPVIDAFAQDHARLTLPVRLIWGADDPTFPVGRAREMVAQFPRCDLTEIAGGKLLVHEEKPAEVARATLEFLAA